MAKRQRRRAKEDIRVLPRWMARRKPCATRICWRNFRNLLWCSISRWRCLKFVGNSRRLDFCWKRWPFLHFCCVYYTDSVRRKYQKAKNRRKVRNICQKTKLQKSDVVWHRLCLVCKISEQQCAIFHFMHLISTEMFNFILKPASTGFTYNNIIHTWLISHVTITAQYTRDYNSIKHTWLNSR